jgi:hypothetical protein
MEQLACDVDDTRARQHADAARAVRMFSTSGPLDSSREDVSAVSRYAVLVLGWCEPLCNDDADDGAGRRGRRGDTLS